MPQEGSVAWLVDPVPVADFFSEYWEKQPLIVQREKPGYFSELFSFEAVDELVGSSDLRYPRVVLVKDGTGVPVGEYTENLPWGGSSFFGTAEVERIMDLYRDGATIILQAQHRTWRALKAFTRDLEMAFNFPVQANIYLTPKSSQGFAPHYDVHDVFVLQVSGSKIWRVYGPPPVELPGKSIRFDSKTMELGQVTHELKLLPGDLIYLPRGYVHEALTSDDESLHITVGVPTYTWATVFSEMMTSLDSLADFRKSLPVGFINKGVDRGVIAGQLDELVSFLSSVDRVEQSISKIAERFVSSRPPIVEKPISQVYSADAIEENTRVKVKPRTLYSIQNDGEHSILIFERTEVKLPTYVEPVFRDILQRETFTPGDLDTSLDSSGRITLVRSLVRAGFLTIV